MKNGGMKNSMLELPVSMGEALDKLSVLELKIEYTNNEECVKEAAIIRDKMSIWLKSRRAVYYYRILKSTNRIIWHLQERSHTGDIEIYKAILLHNDRRFKIKEKINRWFNSDLREIKSYPATQCVIYTHLGMGDMIWMNGAVRYLATMYDKVLVICKRNNENNVREMYSDDMTIKVITIKDDAEILPFDKTKVFFNRHGYDVYACGANVGKPVFDLPNSFYDDLGIDRSVRTEYFYYCRPKWTELFAEVHKFGSYVFIHEQSLSNPRINKSIYEELFKDDSRLILDPNKNHYLPAHQFYDIAEKVVGLSLSHYVDLIENAEELHMVESSFYCLASHLDLSRVSVKKCYFPHDPPERLGVFSTGVL